MRRRDEIRRNVLVCLVVVALDTVEVTMDKVDGTECCVLVLGCDVGVEVPEAPGEPRHPVVRLPPKRGDGKKRKRTGDE